MRNALEQLRNLARYKTHAGYRWAAIMDDGALVCEKCASTPSIYRLMYRSTKLHLKDPKSHGDGWRCIGITNSGESEETETCDHCGHVMWEHEAA